MKLDAWLKQPGNTVTGLADTIGISQPSVSGWRNRLARPLLEYREALERICGIPVADWETEDERQARLALAQRLANLTVPAGDDVPTDPGDPPTIDDSPAARTERTVDADTLSGIGT